MNQFIPKPAARHRQIWAQLWKTPQACAWSQEQWRWPVVADLTRCMVESERPGAPIAVMTAIRQLRDDLGLSTAGLRQHGWAIAQPAAAAETSAASATPVDQAEVPARRLRAVT